MFSMTETKIKDDILNSVAPCSMFCSTCTGCQFGEISTHSKELLRLLEGHEEFLEKNLKKEYIHKLDEFKAFTQKLKKYAYPKCAGCRNGRSKSCCIKNCFIPECAKDHNVDFCADCLEFPCDKVNKTIFKESTIEKWLEGNKEIKARGIIAYYKEHSKVPHYIKYKEIDKK